jgi:RNA polymerase sigma-70 factor, ECF subfamily
LESCNGPGAPDIGPVEPQSRSVSRAAPISPAERDWFEAAFKASAKALWCIAAAIVKDRSLAHDIVQEAAVVAMSKLGEFDRSTSFAAWAGQIVRFTALNELRRKGRSPRSGEDQLGTVSGSRIDPAPPHEDELRSKLATALETLDDTARACLLMRTVMGMSYQEISDALDVPEGTAMSHVHRSRQALRTKLMPHWETAEGGTGGAKSMGGNRP